MKKTIKNIEKRDLFIPVFFVIAVFAVGLFHNPTAFAAAAALGIYLIYSAGKNKELSININLTSVSVFCILAFYLLSSLWAIDSGEAVFGFFRYLSVALFLLVMMQKNAPSQKSLFNIVAYSGAVMTLVSAILMQVPMLSEWFSVAGRLSGFWQYPNSFAMFLLCGLVILITKEKLDKLSIACIPVLVFGILYSGSRIVFAITLVVVAAAINFRRGKKTKIIIGIFVTAIIALALVFAALSGNFQILTRFLSTSLSESTFVGRLLYMADALPLLIKYPFGMGYMGYYFVHPSIQTGVYSLSFVHNEFLQLALDIGWIPAALFIAAIFRSFFKKGTSLRKRLLIFSVCAHNFFDFDLQYMAMMMLFLLFLDFESGKAVVIKSGKNVICTVVGILSAISIYLGIGQAAYYLGSSELAYGMNNGDTLAAMQILMTEDDSDKISALSQTLVEKNKYCSIAYSAKANTAFSKGDIITVMESKQKVLELTPFEYDEYAQYCKMLVYCIQTYSSAGDNESAEICRQELISTVNKLESLDDRLSDLGKMIKDQPKTKLTGEIAYYVKEYTKND